MVGPIPSCRSRLELQFRLYKVSPEAIGCPVRPGQGTPGARPLSYPPLTLGDPPGGGSTYIFRFGSALGEGKGGERPDVALTRQMTPKGVGGSQQTKHVRHFFEYIAIVSS